MYAQRRYFKATQLICFKTKQVQLLWGKKNLLLRKLYWFDLSSGSQTDISKEIFASENISLARNAVTETQIDQQDIARQET